MSRWWNEFVGTLADGVSGGVPMLAFLSLLATVLIALGWYFWPSWLPWNWNWGWAERSGRGSRGKGDSRPRLRFGRLRWRWRWRWRRRRASAAEQEPMELSDDELPDLPAQVMTLTADQLAAAGRYKEAVRERLRAIVRDLVERGVIPFSPGWTIAELAGHATRTRPELAPPLRVGIAVFSEIWYGLRDAHAADDEAMRATARDVSALLLAPAGRSGGAL